MRPCSEELIYTSQEWRFLSSSPWSVFLLMRTIIRDALYCGKLSKLTQKCGLLWWSSRCIHRLLVEMGQDLSMQCKFYIFRRTAAQHLMQHQGLLNLYKYEPAWNTLPAALTELYNTVDQNWWVYNFQSANINVEILVGFPANLWDKWPPIQMNRRSLRWLNIYQICDSAWLSCIWKM